MMRQIIFDTETTGLDPKQGHRIIEIGGVELINRRFTGNNFHIYLNPEREVDAGALSVHGLNNAFLADKPKFQEILAQLLAYMQGAEIVIHNAAFDIGFLEHELRLANAAVQKISEICRIVDTLILAREMHPGQKNSLDALCKRYKVDNTDRSLHGALLDAQILARVYLAMTGGQSTLLADTTETKETSQIQDQFAAPTSTIKADHLVVLADAKELEAHQALLETLNKKSKGQCIWLSSSENTAC
ncbi:MAG: polymerase subunit epsilon [Gammaproteobacteria bacterium]|jgi:DNA polymerase-3 subunit epsilon|nr:polymerase subunit epsilon [Gammaproteobacteria bacterium]